MTNDEKYNLITRNLEEVLTPEELKALIASGTPLKHYIGFEISGKLHIGYLFQLMKVKDLHEAGVETIIWLADLHSAINDKLDGNLETIKKMAYDYFVEAMKALFQTIGGDTEKLQFKLCSETYAQNPSMWQTLLEVGKNTTLARNLRSTTIMGREQSEDIDSAKLMYPLMQASDIFLLQTNIAHAGIDQRKVHVIARDVANQIKTNVLKDISGTQIKPIAIHMPILLGLMSSALDSISQKAELQGSEEKDIVAMKTKMSKSKAGSGISIHDLPNEIKQKINQAYAPEGIIDGNPVLNWTKYLIFYGEASKLEIKRDEKFGGDITYTNYEDLENDYKEKRLHPMDLKNAVAEWLIIKLEPARKYFEDPKRKAALEEMERLTHK